MANFVFETATQDQAATFVAGDYLIFSSSTASAVNVTVQPSDPNNTLSPGIVITSGGKSLTFNSANLSSSSLQSRIVFNDSSNLILGTGTADTAAGFQGTTAADVVYGFAGDDSLGGGDGADYLYGGVGLDTLNGGDGNDHLYGNSLTTLQGAADGADTINGDAGADYIQGNAGNDLLSGGTGSDRIFGGAGNDTISGGDQSDTVNGNAGNDSIDGGAGNDVLRGGQGTDTINGNADNDIIYGDLGDDTITGGAGFDVLFGGDGNDTFVFGATDASNANIPGSGSTANITDVIADYTDGADKIDLAFAVTSVVRDTQGTTFATLQAAQTYAQQLLDASGDVAGQVAALRLGSDTYLFFGGATGADAIDQAIKLVGVGDPTVITTTDFV